MKRDYNLTQLDINTGIKRFLLDAYSSSVPSKNPKLMIIAAGPGSGKTGIEMFYKRELAEAGERGAIVNSDRIAEYHPQYDDALEELPGEFYKISRQFVRPASPVIFEELRNRNINIINENVLNKGEADIEQIRKFKMSGYHVSINVMATDSFIAKLSCYEREARDLEEGEMPRGIDNQNFKNMYNGFIKEIYDLQNLNLCDEVNVYTRGKSINQPMLIYKTGDTKYKDFYEAIVAERNEQRRGILKNPGEYLKKVEKLQETIRNNGISQELTKNAINGLDELKNEFIKELNKGMTKMD